MEKVSQSTGGNLCPSPCSNGEGGTGELFRLIYAFRFQISSRRRHCFIGILLRCAFTSGWNAVNAYRPRAYSVTRLLLTTTLVRLGGGESQVWRTQRDAESSNTKHETIEKRYLIDCDRWTRILDRICEIEDDDTSRQLLLIDLPGDLTLFAPRGISRDNFKKHE